MDSKAHVRVITFDQNGDTLIILPYSTHQEVPDEDAPKPLFSPLSFAADGNKSSTKYGENETPVDIALEEHEVHMKVSKKHLVLASSRARTALQGPWQESDRKTADGLYHWSFEPIFTLEAFEIVMRIIHGHTRNVPHEINLKTLADIAAVVDDLRCEEAVWFFAKSWIDRLKQSLPVDICEDLARWIMVASVFDEPAIFQQCTKVGILHSRKALDTAGLPIRPPIIDSMEAQRTATLDAVLAHLKQQRDILSRGVTFCTFECRSSLLGALIQGMHSTGVLPVPPTYISSKPRKPRHLALSVSSAIRSILNIQSPVVYSPVGAFNLSKNKNVWSLGRTGQPSTLKSTNQSKAIGIFGIPADPNIQEEEKPPPVSLEVHGCSLKALLEPQLTALEKGIVGLTLGDFVSE